MAGKRKYSNGSVSNKRGRTSTRKTPRISKSAAKSLVLGLRETKANFFTLTPTDILQQVSTSNTFRSFRIAQGDSSITRDGNEIYATGIYAKLQITANQAAANKAYVRVLLLTPKLNPDDLPVNVTMTSAIDTDKFWIHKDFMVSVCNDDVNTYNTENSKFITVKHKFKKAQRVTYGGSTTPIKAVPCLYLVAQPSGAGYLPRMTQGLMYNYFKER